MACENKTNAQKRKPAMFSQTEIEVARTLIQLGNRVMDSSTTFLDEDRHNCNNSYSLQWKPQQSKGDTCADESPSSSDAIEDVLAEIEENESFRRRKKRIRYIQDLYNTTEPLVNVPAFKAKKIKCKN
ncbi:hypothetical protein VNO77_22336 [Canavalia gladiata]|uniref:Uncharacterized protein n=1 Tax=Canavalia gladiata TaxID=3824 RepID=A0AAN9QAX6_CANGL